MESKSYNVLIVEDEYINAKFIEQILLDKGHKVVKIVANSQDAISLSQEEKIDLVFMDINIEGSTDGIQCASLLNNRYQIPIIYMTAYGDAQTIEEASSTNIFGYIIKPFDTADVEAALAVAQKMLKNESPSQKKRNPSSSLEFSHNYIYSFETQSLKIGDRYIELTKKESLLLHLFCLNINQITSYDTLLEYVWKNHVVTNSTIRDTISRLRRKAPLLKLENISGIGYRLIQD